MEGMPYWIFLLVLYLFSILVKRRQKKAAYEKLENEEESGQRTPQFVKNILSKFDEQALSDIIEPAEIAEDISAVEDVPPNEIRHSESVETQPIPLKDIYLADVDWSTIGDQKPIRSIARRKGKVSIKRMSFFKSPHNLKTAFIYKELLDKPRSLRRKIR